MKGIDLNRFYVSLDEKQPCLQFYYMGNEQVIYLVILEDDGDIYTCRASLPQDHWAEYLKEL